MDCLAGHPACTLASLGIVQNLMISGQCDLVLGDCLYCLMAVNSIADTAACQLKTSCVQVVMTISQGKVVWDGSSLHVQRGAGRFLPRPAFGDLYKGLDERDAIRSAEMYPYGPVPVKRDLAALHAKQEL